MAHDDEPAARRMEDRYYEVNWTAVDNYEWLHGFAIVFGIIDRQRNVRPSARVLQREATARPTQNG